MRSTGFALAALVCGSLALPRTSEAQFCSGFNSFRDRPFQVGGELTVNNNNPGFATTLRGGKKFFGMVRTGITRYNQFSAGSSNDLSAGGGYEITPEHSSRIFACPIAIVGISSGPIDVEATGIDFHSLTVSAGAGVGSIVACNAGMQIVPSFGVRGVQLKTTATDENTRIDYSTNNTYGIVSGGLGIILRRTFTVRPGFMFPFGFRHLNANLPFAVQNTKGTFTLNITANFGRRASEGERRSLRRPPPTCPS